MSCEQMDGEVNERVDDLALYSCTSATQAHIAGWAARPGHERLAPNGRRPGAGARAGDDTPRRLKVGGVSPNDWTHGR